MLPISLAVRCRYYCWNKRVSPTSPTTAVAIPCRCFVSTAREGGGNEGGGSTSSASSGGGGGGPVTRAYRRRVDSGSRRRDADQFRVAHRLDALYESLRRTDPWVRRSEKLKCYPRGSTWTERCLSRLARWATAMFQPTPPKGVYIYGSVGVGKSYLMDMFYETVLQQQQQVDVAQNRKIRRVHFHEFMLDVHGRIHRYRQLGRRGDPIPAVALSLAKEARILCFDEFQVTDVADAAILKRLFECLWRDHGAVVVATSNRAPSQLYEGGIHRDRFLPFVDALRASLDVIEMTGTRDYRQNQAEGEEEEEEDATTGTTVKTATTTNSSDDDDNKPNNINPNKRTAIDPCYFLSNDEATREALASIFHADGTTEPRSETVAVKFGRTIRVRRAGTRCAWLDFDELCRRPLGPADYWALCERFPVLIVDRIPQLNSSRINEARRFVTLVDALYENRTKLVAATDVPIERLFVDFDAAVESTDGDEEIGMADVNVEKGGEKGEKGGGEMDMFVKAEGGSSSSRATTMIRTKDGQHEVEWSATGRIGVSLAQLSSVRDVSFSFQRAASRLNEMKRRSWGRSTIPS